MGGNEDNMNFMREFCECGIKENSRKVLEERAK
jgi:hypothetical protein